MTNVGVLKETFKVYVESDCSVKLHEKIRAESDQADILNEG